MDWINNLVDGIGKVLSDTFSQLWNTASTSIWDVFIRWFYDAIFGAIADFLTMISGMGAELFDLPWVTACLKLFSLFGWALFISGLAVAIFEIAIEYQSMGHFNLKQQVLPIIYGFFAVNLFTTIPVKLYTFCLTLQNILMHDLTGVLGMSTSLGNSLPEIAINALLIMNGQVSIVNLFFVIALGYCVIKVFFGNIKRGGILLTQIAVGSLYMFSIPKGYTDGIISWCKQIIALCLTAFLQMTLLFLGLITWQSNIILGLGVMLAANEVPRIAQTFGLDTSVKVNMMSAVHTTTTAINLARTIAKK